MIHITIEQWIYNEDFTSIYKYVSQKIVPFSFWRSSQLSSQIEILKFHYR